jgi:hypothetical protein
MLTFSVNVFALCCHALFLTPSRVKFICAVKTRVSSVIQSTPFSQCTWEVSMRRFVVLFLGMVMLGGCGLNTSPNSPPEDSPAPPGAELSIEEAEALSLNAGKTRAETESRSFDFSATTEAGTKLEGVLNIALEQYQDVSLFSGSLNTASADMPVRGVLVGEGKMYLFVRVASDLNQRIIGEGTLTDGAYKGNFYGPDLFNGDKGFWTATPRSDTSPPLPSETKEYLLNFEGEVTNGTNQGKMYKGDLTINVEEIEKGLGYYRGKLMLEDGTEVPAEGFLGPDRIVLALWMNPQEQQIIQGFAQIAKDRKSAAGPFFGPDFTGKDRGQFTLTLKEGTLPETPGENPGTTPPPDNPTPTPTPEPEPNPTPPDPGNPNPPNPEPPTPPAPPVNEVLYNFKGTIEGGTNTGTVFVGTLKVDLESTGQGRDISGTLESTTGIYLVEGAIAADNAVDLSIDLGEQGTITGIGVVGQGGNMSGTFTGPAEDNTGSWSAAARGTTTPPTPPTPEPPTPPTPPTPEPPTPEPPAPSPEASYTFKGVVTEGTNKDSVLDGTLTITLGEIGQDGSRSVTGSLETAAGPYPVTGTLAGDNSIEVMFDLGAEGDIMGQGTVAADGNISGTFTGPASDDKGTWTATTTTAPSPEPEPAPEPTPPTPEPTPSSQP